MNDIPRTEQIIKPDGTVISTRVPTSGAARFLGLRPHTLRVWRLLNKGPRYTRYSGTRGGKTGRCYYDLADLIAFVAARSFGSTAEETMKAANEAGR